MESGVLPNASAGNSADVLTSAPRARRGWAHIGKRLLDLVLSVPLIIAAAPLIAILALAIKLDSPGPVFYRCRRVGFHGRPLEMLKFRKMIDGSTGPPITTADDPRLTRRGRFLAVTKLDEIPQLWHVIAGEMSLVGPRPEDPEFVALYPREYGEILAVKPGITGLCQLGFANERSILDAEDVLTSYVTRVLPAKVRIDLLYARRRSALMDITILAWTAVAVLLRKDVAVHRASGHLSLRRRRRVLSLLSLGTGERSC